MDIFEFICILAGLITVIIAVKAYFSGKFKQLQALSDRWEQNPVEKLSLARELRKAAEEDRKTAESDQKIAEAQAKSAAAHAARYAPAAPGVAPWVGDLLTSFGVDPNVLFQEAMPPELQKILPMVRGFLESGGLEKLLGSVPGAQPGPGREEEL